MSQDNSPAFLLLNSAGVSTTKEGAAHFLLHAKGATMPRQYVDCREFPSDTKCSVAISADNERELIEAAVQHAVAVHGHSDTPEFRQMLATAIKTGTPPVESPMQMTS